MTKNFKSDNKTVTCHGCNYFYITHRKQRPWGCKKFRFKSKNLPNDEVRQATGMDCAYFTMKQFIKSTERRSNGN